MQPQSCWETGERREAKVNHVIILFTSIPAATARMQPGSKTCTMGKAGGKAKVEQRFNSALPAKSNDLFDSGAIALAEEPHWTCPVFLKSFMMARKR